MCLRQLFQQLLKQRHLPGVDLLRGAAIHPPQELLQLMLQSFDGTVALRLRCEQLIALGTQQLDFPPKLLKFIA